MLVETQKMERIGKINQKFEADVNSILGTYKRVNPELRSPVFYNTICCLENDRKIITRYRTGCHKLKIQTGRLSGDHRDSRMCTCLNEIQTLPHVLFNCPLTATIRESMEIRYETLESFFGEADLPRIASILKIVEKKLKL